MKRFMFAYNEVATGVVVVYAEDEDTAREMAEMGDGDVHINKSNEDVGELIDVTEA